MQKFKNIVIIICLFLAFFMISANSYARAISSDLSSSFFRLHILANSDSKEDQALKLKVRDAMISYMDTLITENQTKEEIITICQEHLQDFENIAQNVIQENGFDYTVSAKIGNFAFPTKKYGNIALPAGNYDALRIEIGQAEGQNWWCSLFPPLCFVDISSGVIDEEGENYLKENLSDEEFLMITSNTKDIQLKFKLIEILNEKINLRISKQ